MVQKLGEEAAHAEIEVNGRIFKACLDSGSGVTLMSEVAWKSLGQAVLEPVRARRIKAVNGQGLETLGTMRVRIKVGSIDTETDVLVVAGVVEDFLLGTDFLRDHKCVMDFSTGKLSAAGVEIPMSEPARMVEPIVRRVTLTRDVTIPGRTEMVVNGQVQCEHVHCTDMPMMLEPGCKRNDIRIARTLVSGSQGTFPLRVANFSSRPVKLFTNSSLGTLLDVDVAVHDSTEEVCGTVTTGGDEHLRKDFEALFDFSESTLDEEDERELRDLLFKYRDVFATSKNDLGRTSMVKHTIQTDSNAQPVRRPPYRLPGHYKQEVQGMLGSMLDSGVVAPSNSPWSAPVILIRKQDGTLRFCVDYRGLNAVTRRDSYPLPRIDETLDALKGARLFSTLDLASGYWQVEMEEEDRCKTAFSLPGMGLYEFTVMPFGLVNAPSTFQRLMEVMLSGLQYNVCLIYLDDVIIFGHNLADHLSRLEEVFIRLRAANLKLKPSKCTFLCLQVRYLGHIVSQEGVSPDPKKIEAVKNWPQPKSTSDVRQFLGLASYYRRFVTGFASVAAPLTRLLEKNCIFQWTPAAQHSFSILKHRLTSSPVLAFPDFQKEFILDTDASLTGIGAVLSQIEDGKERVVAYASRTLSKAERRYDVTRRELLAVVSFIHHFRYYLLGKRFTLRTDHEPLKWLFNVREPAGQLARWLERLAAYDFAIVHRPGIRHSNADALSRLVPNQDDEPDQPECALTLATPQQTSPSPSPSSPPPQPSPEPSVDVNVVQASVAEDAVPSPPLTDTSEATPAAHQGDPPKSSGSDWSASWSPEELVELQGKDPDLRIVAEWLRANQPPATSELRAVSRAVRHYAQEWSRLEVVDGVLFRRYTADTGSNWLQLLVPASLRSSVLAALHDHPATGAHLGVLKTTLKARNRFHWYGMGSDIRRWIQACSRCEAVKSPHQRQRAPLGNITAGYPWQRIAIDLVGPLPSTARGNRYILSVTDYFSKWAEAFALRNAEAKTVARVLVDRVICQFGAPESIHTDQGAQFESSLFQEMCALLHIKKTRTTAYHPESDGQTERFNRTLRHMLRTVVAENLHWDDMLPSLLLAYRSSVHASTGYTPHYLLFGCEARLPVDVVYGLPEPSRLPATEHVAELQERLETAHRLTRHHLQAAQLHQKEFYDRRCHGAPYSVGDLVWLLCPAIRPGESGKFHRPWRGPCRVTEVIGQVNYRVSNLDTDSSQVVHFNRLKPCHAVPRPHEVPVIGPSVPTPVAPSTHPQVRGHRPPHPWAEPDDTSALYEEPEDDSPPLGSSRPQRAHRLPAHLEDFALY